MMMIGGDPDRGALTPSSDLSDSSDIVGTPGVIPFVWEDEPGRPKGPNAASSSNWPAETSDESSPDAHIMKLNLRASLMGVHILDDETEMFFSRQVSNASSNTHIFQSGAGAVSLQPIPWAEPSMGPLTPPPGSGLLYPTSGLLYYGPPPQSDLGPDPAMHFSEKLFKKLVGQSRAYDEAKSKRRGESSTETLDRHFGHYSSDMRTDPDNDSVSPTSTLEHPETESSPSSESERFYPSRNPSLARYLDAHTSRARYEASTSAARPSSQLAQCLLSLTAMADDTTDEDDIIFEQPSTTAPLQPDWPVVEYQAPPTKPQHRHPKSATTSPKSGRTIERWSSNSSSWNLSLLSKPKSTVTKVSVSGSRKSKRSKSNGVTLREVHNGASTSTALTYDRSGDANGRHKWERDSSGSLPSAEELGFEAYDRPGETVHTLDEEDFPFSPIASSFVFGEHNNSVEFSQRGGRSGIPRAVGPIVQEFTSSNFELLDFQETMSNLSEGSHTYSLESGFLQPELDWIPTKSFHYIKGPSVEIVELGTSNRVFNGYIEINHSGRFSIDLQRGPRLERHQGWSAAIEKTPDVLLRIVEEASSMSHRRRSNATKYGCFSTCRCLPVRKKGLLGRCLTSNQTHRVAVANSFESRLRSRSLGSVSAKNQTSPFQFF